MTIAADQIDVTAGGVLIGLLLGALVYALLEWVGAPRLVSGLAAITIFVLLALDP